MKTALIVFVVIVVIVLVYYFLFVRKAAKKSTTVIQPIITSVQSTAFQAATKEAIDIINNSPVFTDAKKSRIQSLLQEISTTKDQENVIVAQALRENISLTNAILKNLLQRLDHQMGVADGTNYALLVSSGRL